MQEVEARAILDPFIKTILNSKPNDVFTDEEIALAQKLSDHLMAGDFDGLSSSFFKELQSVLIPLRKMGAIRV